MAAPAVTYPPEYTGTPEGCWSPIEVNAAFTEDASGLYLTSVRAGKVAAGCTNSASKSGDKLNPLSFMTLLAARRQMVWVGLGLPPAGTSSPPPKTTSTASASGSAPTPRPQDGAPASRDDWRARASTDHGAPRSLSPGAGTASASVSGPGASPCDARTARLRLSSHSELS